MPRLVPFEHWHLSKFINRDTGISDDWRIMLANFGVAYTAIDDNFAIIGCGGMFIPCDGVGIVWMSLSDNVMRYPVWLTRITRAMLRQICEINRIDRVESVVRSDKELYQKWLEVMGFKLDTEYLRYVMVK